MQTIYCLLVLVLIIFIFVNLKKIKSISENFSNQSESLYMMHKKQLQKNVWDDFCVQTPPPCQSDNDCLIQRNPPIGCWCKEQKSTYGVKDNDNFFKINYNPFAAFRR